MIPQSELSGAAAKGCEQKKNFYCGGIVAESAALKSVVLSVRLNSEARRAIEQVREETGIPAVEATARLLEWFTSQDRKLRRAILDRDEEWADEIVKTRLAQMAAAGEVTAPITVPEAVKIIHIMTDFVASVAKSQDVELKKLMPKPQKR